mmetsp:Transcript_23349/g.25731  ORF Transcript_23349/g.25731 Transcript_23349/m.25731 type:complete len:183 (+) Transcript_23349:134-682(+)
MYFYITLSALIFATGATGRDFNLRSHQDMNDEVKVQKLRNELDILEEIATSKEEFKATEAHEDRSNKSKGKINSVMANIESRIEDEETQLEEFNAAEERREVINKLESEINFMEEEIDQTICARDVKECPDGSYVGRDHSNRCKFHSCPVVCGSDVHQCWYGRYVSRDPDNNCAFESCYWWW